MCGNYRVKVITASHASVLRFPNHMHCPPPPPHLYDVLSIVVQWRHDHSDGEDRVAATALRVELGLCHAPELLALVEDLKRLLCALDLHLSHARDVHVAVVVLTHYLRLRGPGREGGREGLKYVITHVHSRTYIYIIILVRLSVQTITRAFVRLGASDSTRALLGVAGRSSSLSLAVCARPAKIRSLLRRHTLVWAAILCAHAPRCNCDDLYPTGHVRRTGSY